jgi:hypothetical protein
MKAFFVPWPSKGSDSMASWSCIVHKGTAPKEAPNPDRVAVGLYLKTRRYFRCYFSIDYHARKCLIVFAQIKIYYAPLYEVYPMTSCIPGSIASLFELLHRCRCWNTGFGGDVGADYRFSVIIGWSATWAPDIPLMCHCCNMYNNRQRIYAFGATFVVR